jgi:hypothetical protein
MKYTVTADDITNRYITMPTSILGVVGGISYLSYRGMQRPAYDPNTFSELEINENRKLLAISKANKPAMFNVYFEF